MFQFFGFQNDRKGMMPTTMINEVDTMTTRRNDLVVKKRNNINFRSPLDANSEPFKDEIYITVSEPLRHDRQRHFIDF